MPMIVTAPPDVPEAVDRNVRRSIVGAATVTPSIVRIESTVASDRPRSRNDETRRSAFPTRSWTVRSMAASRPAPRVSEADRTPTPRATPRMVRNDRSGRATTALPARLVKPIWAYSPIWASRAMSGAAEWSVRRPRLISSLILPSPTTSTRSA